MAAKHVPAQVRKWFREQARKAGQARMQKLTPRKRRALARRAAAARWKKPSGARAPRVCVYCAGNRARTKVRGGYAHKRCLPAA